MDLHRQSLVAVLLVAATALSPLDTRAQAVLGVNAGVSVASLEGDDVDDSFGSTTGLIAGASLSFPLGGIISLAPGLYFVQKGGSEEEGSARFSLELDYLEVPILGVFRVTAPERPIGVSLYLGPSVAFELSCSEELEIGDESESVDCDEDPDNEDRRTTDFGAVFGAGVSFPFGGLRAQVNGGLDVGLRSLDGSSEANDVKNSVWFLMAGLAFPLGG